MCSKTGKRFLRWLLLPPQECTLLFVIGIAAWLLLRALTKWTVDSNWVYMPHLLVDLYVLGLLVCLLPKKGRSIALVAIYIIMYMSGFAESFIYQRYYMHFTPQTLTMIEETTPTESSGFLRLCWESPIMWKTLMWWGMLLTLHILLLVGRWFACRMWPKIKTRTMPWVVRGFTTLIVISLFWWIPARCEVIKFLMLERTEQAERIDNGIFYSTPWRVVYALKFDQLSQRELLTLAQNMQKISGVESDSGVPLIVLVIGESHNKHHSSVYGYSLPTTPWQSRMTQEGTGIIMQDAVTPWNVTSSVFKEMFSTHSCDQPGLWTDGVLFPALMRKAGYRVGFISNQFYKTNRQTSANYTGSFFLNSQPFDSLCFDYRNTKHYVYDIGMLKEWTPMISSREFIILHLLGQHQPYDERLTKKGHVFSAKNIKRKDLTQQERQTVADYDNATLENDRLLQRVWERIGDNDAVMIYLSDHGEEIYDGNIGMFGRNHMAEPTPEIMWAEFEVPLEIFVSKKAQKNHPWLMAALQEARIKPLAIDDIPHLIMRLGDVRCNYYNAERDPLSTTFKPRLRPVKGGITTYEKLMNRL